MLNSAIDNDGKHVATILNRTNCDKHQASTGIPCWNIPIEGFGYLAAVCGLRIKRAGYNGKVTPTSLQQNIAGGRSKPIRGTTSSGFRIKENS